MPDIPIYILTDHKVKSSVRNSGNLKIDSLNTVKPNDLVDSYINNNFQSDSIKFQKWVQREEKEMIPKLNSLHEKLSKISGN